MNLTCVSCGSPRGPGDAPIGSRQVLAIDTGLCGLYGAHSHGGALSVYDRVGVDMG